MARFIVRLGTKYVEWSTVSDAPCTWGMSREQLAAHFENEYGRVGTRDFEERMARVDATGTSELPDQGETVSAEGTTSGNRAGLREEELSFPELVALYDGGDRDLDVIKRKHGQR